MSSLTKTISNFYFSDRILSGSDRKKFFVIRSDTNFKRLRIAVCILLITELSNIVFDFAMNTQRVVPWGFYTVCSVLAVICIVFLFLFGWKKIKSYKCAKYKAVVNTAFIILLGVTGSAFIALDLIENGTLVNYVLMNILLCVVVYIRVWEIFPIMLTYAVSAIIVTVVFNLKVSIVQQVSVAFLTFLTMSQVFYKTFVDHYINEQKIKLAYQSLDRISRTDTLTEVYNRRAFDVELCKKWEEQKNRCENLSVMMLDIDDFKKYNDYYGHLEGDVVLRSVAQVLKQALPEHCSFIARFGGEEFIAILVGLEPEDTYFFAQKACDQVWDRKIPFRHSKSGEYLTVSIGVCTMIPNDESPSTIIRFADEELYKAKHKGKHQVSMKTELMNEM